MIIMITSTSMIPTTMIIIANGHHYKPEAPAGPVHRHLAEEPHDAVLVRPLHHLLQARQGGQAQRVHPAHTTYTIAHIYKSDLHVQDADI